MPKLLPRFSGLAAALTFAFGLWAVSQAGVTGAQAQDAAALYIPMMPTTAVLFVLLGGAHAARRLAPERAALRRAEQWTAGLSIVAVIVVLSQDLPLLAALWRDLARWLGVEGSRPLARMAPSSGLAFLLTAASMLSDAWSGPRARRLGNTCAALGIVIGCFGLSRAIVAHPAALASRPMALMAAGGFVLLNLALLLDRRHAADGTDRRVAEAGIATSPRFLAATLILVLVAASAGSISMRQRSDAALLSMRRDLDAFADAKAAQITAWRAARVGEGRYLMRVSRLAEDAFADARDRDRRRLIDLVSPLLVERGARSLTVTAPDGRTLLSLPEGHGDALPVVAPPRPSADAQLGEMRRDSRGRPLLDLTVPVGNPARPSLLTLHLDPSTSLLPVVHEKPPGLKSVESTLWSRDGAHVVLLDEPSHGLRAEGRSATHAASRDLAAALTDLGGRGSLEGVDHHGTPVVGTTRSIPGSPWTLTTTITQQELYAPAQEDASRTAFFVIVFLFGLVGFAAYVAREEGARTLEAALRAERERAATADLFTALMKGAKDMILLFDDAARIVDVNDRVVEAYGYTREELIGSSVARLRADGDEDAVAAHRAALTTPDGGHFESLHRRKDGTTFPIEVSGRGMQVDGRTVVMAIYRDVSERRAQEEALRRSEERLRLLGDNLPDSYLYQLVLEDTGTRRFAYASSGVARLHGIAVSDLLEDPTALSRQASPEDRDRLAAAEAASLRDMTDFALEIRIHDTAGEEKWLQIRSRPRREGTSVVWDGVATDVTARKKADEALREVQSAVDHSPVSILITDAGWAIRHVNPAFTRVTGYLAAEAIGRTPRELLGDDNPQALHDEVEAALRDGRTWDGVFRNRRKNGERFWESTRIAAIRDDRGEVTSYVAVKEDITARRAAEEALKASESKLSVALDIADLGCYETWMEDDRGAVDERTRSLFGIRDEKESEMRAALLANVHDQDRDRVLDAVRRFRTGESDRFEAEYRYARPGGPEIRVSHIARAIERAPDGSVTHTIGVVKDVTADRTAAEALRASEERHRLLADNANDVIWTTDVAGRLTYVSPSVERLRGFAPAELMGHSVLESVTPEHRARIEGLLAEAVAGFATGSEARERAAIRFEIDQPRRDGSVVHTEATASPLFDTEGRFIGILGVTRDMTARHAADQALKASEVRLQMAVEAAGLGIIETRNGRHVGDAMALGILALHDVPPEQVTRVWASRVHEADLDRVTEAREAFLAGRIRSAAQEYRYHHPERGIVWISHTSRALEFDELGRTVRAVVVVKDVTEFRKAEEDLRISESRLAMALDAAELGLYWSDGTRFGCDARASEILGTPGSVWNDVREYWTRHIHPDDVAGTLATMKRLREGEVSQVHLEYRYQVPGRGLAWIAHSVRAAETSESGVPTRVIGVVKDITATTEAAEALRRSEERFRAGLEAIQEGFLVFDRTGRVIAQNAACDRILGPNLSPPGPDEARPPRFQMIREDGAPVLPDEWPSSITFRTGQGVRDSVIGILHAGATEPRWISISSAPIGDGDSPEMVVLFFTDITARRKAEQLLRLAEDRWKFAIEGAGDGVWDWDVPSGACVFSPRWKRMLGYEDDEIGGDLKEWTERVHPDDLAGTLEKLQPHLDGREPSYVAEHRLRCKDGSYKWILDRGLVVSRDAGGRPLRVVGTHSDITERRQAEEELRTLAATRAAQLDELRRWQQAILGREDRIQELKREANALAKAAGREIPYPSQEPVA